MYILFITTSATGRARSGHGTIDNYVGIAVHDHVVHAGQGRSLEMIEFVEEIEILVVGRGRGRV